MATALIRDTIQELVAAALARAQQEKVFQLETMPDILMERPGNAANGDFATSLPLRLARATRINPLKLAETLVEYIAANPAVERVAAAPPGFINFYLNDGWVQQQVETVRQAAGDYGNLTAGQGRRVMVEFVSVNPTGPVHVGHTRGAVLGSALANTLAAAGYAVTREYYVNDAGAQMDAFYRSVYARYRESLGQTATWPANGYAGEYIADLAREIAAAEGRRFLEMDESQAIREIGDLSREKMVALIRDDLAHIGVTFDHWFSERSLYAAREYDAAMARLRENNYLSERDNALWFNSTRLGDDKDNVVVRSSGEPHLLCRGHCLSLQQVRRAGV